MSSFLWCHSEQHSEKPWGECPAGWSGKENPYEQNDIRLCDAIYKNQKNLNERQLDINPMTDIEEGNQVRMKTGLVKPWSMNFASVVMKITHAWLQRQKVCTTERGVTCNLSVKLFLPI